jgi:hypothetical protein
MCKRSWPAWALGDDTGRPARRVVSRVLTAHIRESTL